MPDLFRVSYTEMKEQGPSIPSIRARGELAMLVLPRVKFEHFRLNPHPFKAAFSGIVRFFYLAETGIFLIFFFHQNYLYHFSDGPIKSLLLGYNIKIKHKI
jgi:hypothetical protein